jgi:hypothetical protein
MKIKQKVSMMTALTLSISVLTVMPVAARGINSGHSDSSTTQDVSMNDDTDQSSGSGSSSDDVNPNENIPVNEHPGDVKNLQNRGADDLAKLRKAKPVHTVAERKKSCQALQAEIDKRIAKFTSNAQKHLDNFNGIFDKVQAFQASKNLSVSNYDALVATATDKQDTAASAVAALKVVAVNVDCASPDPAKSVATIKAAVASTHDSLQAYRQAIKDIVVALQGAKS